MRYLLFDFFLHIFFLRKLLFYLNKKILSIIKINLLIKLFLKQLKKEIKFFFST